jgi:subtilisin-like proprotein convertase family protein
MKMSIQKLTVAVIASMAVASVAHATLLGGSWSGNEDIPDGNAVGIANSLNISDPGGAAIQDVSVTLDISGGYNGDLYGYLVFEPSGGGAASIEVLLNQIGTSPSNPFGSATSGLNNVTLSDSGMQGDIHGATGTAGQPLTGSFTPDSPSTLDTTFTGSADGTWTLFLSDMVTGGGTSQLTGWGLSVSVVPEPVTWALIIFVTLLAVRALVLWKLRHRRA